MVWACIEKRRRICRQESDGDGGAVGEGEEDRSRDGWMESGTTCQRELSGEEVQCRVKWKHRPQIKVGKDADEDMVGGVVVMLHLFVTPFSTRGVHHNILSIQQTNMVLVKLHKLFQH